MQGQPPANQGGHAPPGYPGYPPPGGPPPQGYSQPGGPPPQGYPQPGGPPPQGVPPQQGYPQPGVQYAQPGQQPYYQPQPAGYAAPPPGAMPAGYAGQPGQPGGGQPVMMMPKPEAIAGCPPGLEYLTQIDQILVHQQVEMFEVFTNFETPNRYQIKNSQGQQVYFAGEESDTCHRQCCGPNRAFVMHITDNLGAEVIRVNREFKCCAGCNCCAGCDCCAMEVMVEAPPGNVVGKVKQQMSCLAPKYEIHDENDQPILEVEGPVCVCQGPCCTNDQEFVVRTPGGQDCGKISKQWSGFVKEYFTQADNFGVSFPMDLDVKIKAVMIGAVFLIDFMFFEQKQNNNNR